MTGLKKMELNMNMVNIILFIDINPLIQTNGL